MALVAMNNLWKNILEQNCSTVDGRCIAKIIHCDSKGNLLITRKLHHNKFQLLLARANGPAAEPLTAKKLESYMYGEPLEIARTSVLKG